VAASRAYAKEYRRLSPHAALPQASDAPTIVRIVNCRNLGKVTRSVKSARLQGPVNTYYRSLFRSTRGRFARPTGLTQLSGITNGMVRPELVSRW
jgi:hypothetical protein